MEAIQKTGLYKFMQVPYSQPLSMAAVLELYVAQCQAGKVRNVNESLLSSSSLS